MKKVLIIDDDYDLLDIMNRWILSITELSITVELADSGLSAKQKIKQGHWDLIITDVCLDDSTGLEIVEHTQKLHPYCQILMVTGYASPEISISALNMHVQAFLLKPLEKKDFIDKVLELIHGPITHKRKERVLAIGAHPDDVEIGCGGTLLQHVKKGDELCVLTLSNGEQGGQASMRSIESENASQLLNAQLVFGHLMDTCISQGSQTIHVIEKVIRQFQPDIIYTHTNHDAHQDHRNCFKATMVAARTVKNLSCYQSPSSTIEFRPTRFADIEQSLQQKLALIKCYHSQFTKCRYLKPSLIKASAEYWGRYSGYGMVEPFEVIRSA